MSKIFEDYKREFLIENFPEKTELPDMTDDLFDKLTAEEKKHIEGSYNYQLKKYCYHKVEPYYVDDVQLQQYTAMKTMDIFKSIDKKIDLSEQINEKLDTIRKILIFWCALTIIGLIGYAIMLFNLFGNENPF
jgi:hypothetical protein